MANKKIKKIPLNKECLVETLLLRNISIRKLGSETKFGWTTKSVERGIKDGEVSPALMDALGKYLDVDTDYLSGKYHRYFEKINNELFVEILKNQLKAEKFPYLLKQQRIKYDDEFLYDRYLEYTLIIHDISMRQYDILLPEKKKKFQMDLEDAIGPVMIRHFPHNAKGEDTWLDVYKLKNDIENFYSDEPQDLEGLITIDVDESSLLEGKYANIPTIGGPNHENQK